MLLGSNRILLYAITTLLSDMVNRDALERPIVVYQLR
jgi:hypothetical protein